ncbi:MAG: hypothetical protein V4708_02740 [Bacteroidota bacterium]
MLQAQKNGIIFEVGQGAGAFASHLYPLVRRTKFKGPEKIEAEVTIRGGNIVWDLKGISIRDGFQENYRRLELLLPFSPSAIAMNNHKSGHRI